jgi:hypothetical protein
MIFVLGFLTGVAVLMLVALYLEARDAKPKAEPHQFSAVSSGAYDVAAHFRQIFRELQNAEQKTRH